jgi:hypothetical protein
VYYKIINEKHNHNGLQYKEGLNVDNVPFNPSGECNPGGMYFFKLKNLADFLHFGTYIYEVTLPEDAQIYHEKRKSKADKIIISNKRDLREVSTWGHLVKNNVDIHAREECAFRWATLNGYSKVVKFLVESDVDIHAREDWAIRYAKINGHLEIMEYLESKL